MPALDSSYQQEMMVCAVAAAQAYHIPAYILLAVAEKEGGKPGQKVKNTNGTYDVGAMQFNTAYIAELNRKYGITVADVAQSGCYPYQLAAWRISQHIQQDAGDLFTKVANYHSTTPYFNTIYKRGLVKLAEKWQRILSSGMATASTVNVDSKQSHATPMVTHPSVYTYVPRQITASTP